MIDIEELKADIEECMHLALEINKDLSDYLYYRTGPLLFGLLKNIVDINNKLDEIHSKLNEETAVAE